MERGVRFVQLLSGGTFSSPRRNWDGHENMKANHGQEALRIDKPIAGLLRDLRRRGMLDDTLVLFTTEFGRTPFTQSAADAVGLGRDHNPFGFSVWLAGAGLKHGIAHGSTDEIGWKAVEDPVTWPDFHATVLHLLGIDHQKLTFYHNGIRRRLTNVHGDVVRPILALKVRSRAGSDLAAIRDAAEQALTFDSRRISHAPSPSRGLPQALGPRSDRSAGQFRTPLPPFLLAHGRLDGRDRARAGVRDGPDRLAIGGWGHFPKRTHPRLAGDRLRGLGLGGELGLDLAELLEALEEAARRLRLVPPRQARRLGGVEEGAPAGLGAIDRDDFEVERLVMGLEGRDLGVDLLDQRRAGPLAAGLSVGPASFAVAEGIEVAPNTHGTTRRAASLGRAATSGRSGGRPAPGARGSTRASGSMVRSARSSRHSSISRSTPSGILVSLRRLVRGFAPRPAKRSLACSIRDSSKSSGAWRTFLAIAADSWTAARSERTERVAIWRMRITPACDLGFISCGERLDAAGDLRVVALGGDDALAGQAVFEGVFLRSLAPLGRDRPATQAAVRPVRGQSSFGADHRGASSGCRRLGDVTVVDHTFLGAEARQTQFPGILPKDRPEIASSADRRRFLPPDQPVIWIRARS